MAPNADFICRAIANYVAEQLQIPIDFINHLSWRKREKLFDEGQIHVSWMCGTWYVWKADSLNSHLEILVAPVMKTGRYENRPVYFSDVVVHQDSRFQTFADLRGASWAYNEPRSHSGYNVVRYHLSVLGETSGFFGNVVESGAHQTSLQMILNREVDASAIDSTVLELELKRSPKIHSQIRIIETLGPSPMPPWVVLKSVSLKQREALRGILLRMHKDPQGNRILAEAQMLRFVQTTDADYDVIRRMAHEAEKTERLSDFRLMIDDFNNWHQR